MFKRAMKNPCSWCEGEFKSDVQGNTGKSHGICHRHMAAIYQKMGKQPPEPKTSGCVDLAQFAPAERQFLGRLYQVVKTRQQKKGVWEEGRCEDYPCCGHEDGGCPDIDRKTGEQTYRCAGCGTKLPPRSPSSLCRDCLQMMMDRENERPMYGGDYEDVF